MINLIGGPGRAGKTTLAMRLARRHGIPFFSLDYLMMGLHHGAPALDIDPNDREAVVATRMWPVCKPMIVAMLENGEEYCVEGFGITPEHASQLIDLFPSEIRVCFLGYSTVDAVMKLQQEREYLTTNPWPSDRPHEDALGELEFMKEASIALREDCSLRGYAFFDTSIQFDEVITEAELYLVFAQK